jgi:MFS family permease
MSLSTNIKIAKIRSFFFMFLLLVPIMVPYFQSLGLGMLEILKLQAIFCLSMVIFEIPTGYLADLWGRRASLILGGFITGIGFSFLPFARTYEELALYEIALALGASLCSGADIAIVYDSLSSKSNRSKIIGSISQWSLIGEACAAICTSILILWSFATVIWLQLIIGWIPFLLAFFFREPEIKKMQSGKHIGNIAAVARYLVVADPLIRLIFINSVVWGLSSFCVVWLLQPYWSSHSVPLSFFGYMWAVLMFISALVSKYTHLIEAKIGAFSTLLVLAFSSCLAYFLMATNIAWLGISAGILFYINRGLASVVFVDAINWKIPASFRATANSMQSLAFRLGFGVLGPIIGLSVDSVGLPQTLFLMGCCCSVLLVLLMLPLCRRIEELKVGYIPDVVTSG